MKQHFRISERNTIVLLIVASAALVLGDVHSQDRLASQQDVSSADAEDSTAAGSSSSGSSSSGSSSSGLSSSVSSTDDLQAPPLLSDDSPAVRAIQSIARDTPAEKLKATQSFLELGRADLAQPYINELITANLSSAEMYALQREFGSPVLLEIYRSDVLSPESQAFALSVLEAAYAEQRTPARVNGLIDELSDTSDLVRGRALFELSSIGEDSIPYLMRRLADDSRKDEHSRIAWTLVRLEEAAIEPLLGSLRAAHPIVRQAAMEVLGRQNENRMIPHLIRPAVAADAGRLEQEIAREQLQKMVGAVPSDEEAKIYLSRQVDSFRKGALPTDLNIDGTVDYWVWDESSSAPAKLAIPADIASLMIASDLAADLYALWPNDVVVQNTYLSVMMEAELRSVGLDNSIVGGQAHQLAESFGTTQLLELMNQAIRDQQIPAAIGAAQILGEIGTEAILSHAASRDCPLTKSLRHGDRRLRFAAAMAIVKINPRRAYSGSSLLLEALVYFSTSGGDRRILIGHPRIDQSQTLAAALAELGYRAELAVWGNDVFRAAAADADYEMILLSDVIDRPVTNELLQQIRRDPRTSKLPVGILTRQENFTKARRWAESDPLTLALPWPHQADSVQFTATQLQTEIGQDLVRADVRLAQANRALDALLEIVESEEELRFYDVRQYEHQIIGALYTPFLTEKVATLLGMSGSPEAQRELVNLASQELFPIEVRKSAVDALGQAMERRGILLTSTDVQRQYDRYNQSAQQDIATQQVLGSILDAIEAAQYRR